MNYLDMCKSTYRLVGESGAFNSVSTATGFELVVAEAVSEAWEDIQRERPDFTFRRSHSFVKIDSTKQIYSPSTDWGLTDFGYHDKSMLLYDNAPLSLYSYDRFLTTPVSQNDYKINFTSGGVGVLEIGVDIVGDTSGATATISSDVTLSSGSFAGGDAAGYFYVEDVHGAFTDGEGIEVSSVNFATLTDTEQSTGSQPYAYTIIPSSQDLYFNKLNDAYVVDFNYFKKLESLSSNADTPTFRYEWHMLIVYRAVSELASYLGEPVLEQRYSMKYSQMLGQMMRSEVPGRYIKKRPIA